MGADLQLAKGRLSLGGVSTPRPLRAAVGAGGADVSLGGSLQLGWVEEAPGLGLLNEPLEIGIDFGLARKGAASFDLSETMDVAPVGLHQAARAAVSGLDRILAKGLLTPGPLWLTLLGGEVEGSVRLDRSPRLGALGRDFALTGPLEAGAAIRLARGEELGVRGWFRAQDAGFRLKDLVRVEGLDSSLEIAKRYRLLQAAPGGAGERRRALLSEEVLGPAQASGRSAASGAGAARGAVSTGQTGSSLRARRVVVERKPQPLELAHLEVGLDLAGGMPRVAPLQADLLGGTIVGSAEVSSQEEGKPPGHRLEARVSFTGLDAARLVPGGEEKASSGGADSEVSGQLGVSLPLRADLPGVVAGLDLEAALTHVGPLTLDRALYSLDPTESNEAVLKQRRLVRLGSPRWVRVNVRDGNLAVNGQVQVGGVPVDLPRVERVRVAGLAGFGEKGAGALAGMAAVQQGLTALTADAIEIDGSGGLRFVASQGPGVSSR